MTEFMMIFRNNYNPAFKPSPEQMQASIKQWQDWIGSIAAQGKFVSTNALNFEGKIIKHNNVVTDGPYVEMKEMVGGYIVVKANSIDEAIKLADGCPTLLLGGNVEVRSVMKIN
jgi:hypothetical protein